MGDVINLPGLCPADILVDYSSIKRFGENDLGQCISVAEGTRKDGALTYAVIFECRSTFETLMEFRRTELGKQMAEMVAEAADKTLLYSTLHQEV